MCAVSMVIDQWRDPSWPYKQYPQQPYPQPNSIPWPQIQADPALAMQMLEVLKRLEAIDKRLGLMEQCKVSAKEKASIKRALKKAASQATSEAKHE